MQKLDFEPLSAKVPPLRQSISWWAFIWIGISVYLLTTPVPWVSIGAIMFATYLFWNRYQGALDIERLRHFARANGFNYRDREDSAHTTEQMTQYKSLGDQHVVSGTFHARRFMFGTHIQEVEGVEADYHLRLGFLKVETREFTGHVRCTPHSWQMQLVPGEQHPLADTNPFLRSFAVEVLSTKADWQRIITPEMQEMLLSMSKPPLIEIAKGNIYFYFSRRRLRTGRQYIQQLMKLVDSTGQ